MSTPSLAPGTVLGRYRVVEKIGEGGMGVVYRAHDMNLRRDVALKVLRPNTLTTEEARRRFQREAQAVARLAHPNVALAFDFGHENGVDFFVSEYVPGSTLDRLMAGEALPEKTVLDLGVQLATGLEAAHAANLLHRDLKPGNLRITDQGQLKILDFGLSRSIEPTGTTVTGDPDPAGEIIGTLPYMSPEQVRDDPLDQRSDIWAAGVVLYEMATGKRAFSGKNITGTMHAITHDDPPLPTEVNRAVSAGLETVILKALDKDPNARYQSARELRVDLTRLQSGSTVRRDTRRQKAQRKRTDLRYAAVLFAVLALGVAGGWWMRHRGRPPAPHPSIVAVLPFTSSSDEPDTAAVGAWVADTVSAALSQASELEKLQIVSSQELIAKKVQTADDARREFGTDMVIEGTLQHAADKLRINCFLVDSKTKRQIGARTITVEASDAFGLQDRIIAQVFQLLPTAARNVAVPKSVPKTNKEAYAAYVRGRGYLLDYQKPESLDSAVSEFKHAIEKDPSYAPAYAGLGEAYWIGFNKQHKPKTWLEYANTSCAQALKLDAGLPDGHSCEGQLDLGTGKYADAVAQFKEAMRLGGGEDERTVSGLAGAYTALGNNKQAEEAYKQAVALRPNYWGVYSWLGGFYWTQGRYAEAAQQFQRVTELAPENYSGSANLSGALLYEGDYSNAIAAAEKSISLYPNGDAYGNLGAAYYLQHKFERAAAAFEAGLKFNPEDRINWGNLGDAEYLLANRREQASDAYRKAIALAESALEINPKDSSALADVAQYSAMLNDKAKGLSNAEKALNSDTAGAEVQIRAARVYVHFGDKARATELLKKALQAGYPAHLIKNTPEFAELNL